VPVFRALHLDALVQPKYAPDLVLPHLEDVPGVLPVLAYRLGPGLPGLDRVGRKQHAQLLHELIRRALVPQALVYLGVAFSSMNPRLMVRPPTIALRPSSDNIGCNPSISPHRHRSSTLSHFALSSDQACRCTSRGI